MHLARRSPWGDAPKAGDTLLQPPKMPNSPKAEPPRSCRRVRCSERLGRSEAGMDVPFEAFSAFVQERFTMSSPSVLIDAILARIKRRMLESSAAMIDRNAHPPM